jgi:adenylylsulfate kinase
MDTPPARGWTLWLTGLPGSGKTTLARALQERLGADGVPAVVLDSDAVRPILAPTAGYTEADREQFYGRLIALAGLLNGEGANVLIAATAHRRAYRAAARASLAPFAEIWVRCPPVLCAARDPKGLYAQAAAGAVQNLPGVHIPYEPPEAAEAVVDTDRESVATATEAILAGVAFLEGEA